VENGVSAFTRSKHSIAAIGAACERFRYIHKRQNKP